MGRLRRRQRALRRDASSRSRRPTRSIWVHDYHLQLVPSMVRELPARRRHRLLPPHPVPAVGAVRPAAVARARSSTACSAPTCVGFQRPIGRRQLRRHRPAARRRRDAGSSRSPTASRPRARAHRRRARHGRRLPDLHRRRRVRRPRRRTQRPPGGRRPAREPRQPRGRSCSASTASTTPRASGCACGPSARCSTTARSTPIAA